MAATIEEGILSALRGVTTKNTRLPKPLLIKVYVSSLKEEFCQERRMILELVGPELQSLYDDRQIEIEIVDMHFGTGPLRIAQVEQDPYVMTDYLHEIEMCHSNSKSVFFLTLVGDNIGRMPLPTHIDSDIYEAVVADASVTDEERHLLGKWYKLDEARQRQQQPQEQTSSSPDTKAEEAPTSRPDGSANSCRPQYALKEDYREMTLEVWHPEYLQLRDAVERSLQRLVKSSGRSEDYVKRCQALRATQIEQEVHKALELSNDRVLAVFREWSNQLSTKDAENSERLRKLKDELTMNLSSDNYTTLVVSGKIDERHIDPDNEDHEAYLSKFKNKVADKLRNLIEEHIANDPDVIKGRKKTVQEIFHEHATHLRFLREHQSSGALLSSGVPARLRQNLMANYRNGSRHAPYFIQGGHGSGKSAVLTELYRQVRDWFQTVRVHRVIRFSAATPRSAYSLELLRVICQQLSIIFNIPEGYLPKDASFDPLYINNWFQNLLRRIEDMNNDVLFLFIDDLHLLNPLDCDIVAALSWLPASLPWNVQLICTTTTPVDQLKFTPMQRDRFKSSEFLFDLVVEGNRTVLAKQYGSVPEDISFEAFLEKEFDRLEQRYGRKAFQRLAAILTCTEYGLSETELLELLMPTDDPEAFIATDKGNFNFSSLKKIRREMRFMLRDKIMSGKVLIQWRHTYCGRIAHTRYMDAQSTRAMHIEIANIFFQPEGEEAEGEDTTTDDDTTETDKHSVVSQKDNVSAGRKSSSHHNDDTSTFYNPIAADVSYSMRHVEESWHHLMRSDDTNKFKQIAVCNFDFLLAAVQTVSISYLRCLIEHVRCYILDRDIELIYYTIRKSSDVLTRDPMQLGSQLISWLRPISEHDENDNSLLSITVRSATAWCDGYTVPLLVPLTGWLPAPLPSQIRTMTVSGTGPIRDICVAPTKQHLILATTAGDVQLWHIMSNSLEHIFKGHTAAVTCMFVGPQSDILLTGSEDSTVIVWNVSTRELKAHIKAHTAIVSSVTAGVNNTLAISGSEDSSIVIADIHTGIVLHKITAHRGPVTSVKTCSACDVLISASRDKSICLWSLEDYSLLNNMQMASPVRRIDISPDSVFLLVHCEDNGLYLRTLATGKELHTLKGHKSQIRTMAIARDSTRAVVGCEDTRALIYDMLSGKLIRSMPPNPGPVTAVYAMDNDDFLVTVGGNKITFYSFRNEELYVHPYSHNHRRKRSLKRTMQSQRSPSTSLPPISCFDTSRDSQLVAIASARSIHILKINTPEYQTTFDGHSAPVTCLCFAPNGEFIATGSEDRVVNIWNFNLGQVTQAFKGHTAVVQSVVVLMDSQRIISADRDSMMYVWLAEGGSLLQTIQGPYKLLSVTNNMKFAVSTNGETTLKIWSLTREDEKYTVSHAAEITCFTITADSLYIISGSRDMSLKVWQATGGKLAQVLVGHTDAVTCVAVSVTNKTQVISGSKDTNLIIWDLHTGEELHTLAGHLGPVICVKVTADGSTAVSSSDDKTLIVWETKRGLALTSLQMHVPFTRFDISLECSRILVQLLDSFNLPVICLHNTPAQYVKLPTYSAPAMDAEDLRPQGPKRQMKRLLKKEVSLDTYTWQKKYGHLTSSVMMAQVDERLKRRFSVSASMEEISKIAEMKTITSQTNLGPEQAALAQSQHFDQLEALWNKRSPPRRRHNAGLSRQTSLVEDRRESSDDDEYHDERTGMLSASYDHIHSLVLPPPSMLSMRPHSLPLCPWDIYSLSTVATPTKKRNHQHHQRSTTGTTNTTTNTKSTSKSISVTTREHHQQHHNHHLTTSYTASSSAKHHRNTIHMCMQQLQPDLHTPDLVRDLYAEPYASRSTPSTPERTEPKGKLSFFRSIKAHLAHRRNCHSLQLPVGGCDEPATSSTNASPPPAAGRPQRVARLPAMPIIIVENYDQRRTVQRVQTNVVLHPRKSVASLGHTADSAAILQLRSRQGEATSTKEAAAPGTSRNFRSVSEYFQRGFRLSRLFRRSHSHTEQPSKDDTSSASRRHTPATAQVHAAEISTQTSSSVSSMDSGMFCSRGGGHKKRKKAAKDTKGDPATTTTTTKESSSSAHSATCIAQ